MRRRQQILDVAAELFAQRGFHGVTVDDLGDAVGVSGPALYYHFASKEVLLGEMLVSISEYLLDGGRIRVAAAAGPADALDALLRGHIEFALDRTSLITVHIRELVHAPDLQRKRIRALQNEYVELWVDVLLELDPLLERRIGRAGTHAVFGLLNSTPHSRRASGEVMASLLFEMGHAALSMLGQVNARAAVNDKSQQVND
jgi:AcrR family transcriptional regulator